MPLTAFVAHLRAEAAPTMRIPHFDPRDGGVNARALLLLEAPGPRAVDTGFVSRDNPDPTAANLRDLLAGAEIARTDTVIWNVVPWYMGTEARIRSATVADVRCGAEHLARLLPLLPRLRAVAFTVWITAWPCGRNGVTLELDREEDGRDIAEVRHLSHEPWPAALHVLCVWA